MLGATSAASSGPSTNGPSTLAKAFMAASTAGGSGLIPGRLSCILKLIFIIPFEVSFEMIKPFFYSSTSVQINM